VDSLIARDDSAQLARVAPAQLNRGCSADSFEEDGDMAGGIQRAKEAIWFFEK
jgi:hypothetical protein